MFDRVLNIVNNLIFYMLINLDSWIKQVQLHGVTIISGSLDNLINAF